MKYLKPKYSLNLYVLNGQYNIDEMQINVFVFLECICFPWLSVPFFLPWYPTAAPLWFSQTLSRCELSLVCCRGPRELQLSNSSHFFISIITLTIALTITLSISCNSTHSQPSYMQDPNSAIFQSQSSAIISQPSS